MDDGRARGRSRGRGRCDEQPDDDNVRRPGDQGPPEFQQQQECFSQKPCLLLSIGIMSISLDLMS